LLLVWLEIWMLVGISHVIVIKCRWTKFPGIWFGLKGFIRIECNEIFDYFGKWLKTKLGCLIAL
jgi:hypothetical protein